MPTTLATAVPSLWFVTTTTVQLTTRKKISLPMLHTLPLIVGQGERGKSSAELRKGEEGVSGAVQKAPLSACRSWLQRTIPLMSHWET